MIRVIVIFLTLITSSLYSGKSIVNQNQTYKLIWSDEFDQNGPPDSTKWSFRNGFVRNYEPQWYQPENAYCLNGFLVIEARKEKKMNAAYKWNSKDWRLNRASAKYTSANLTTKGKFDFKYGKVLVRAKIDISKGMWPAFWLLGSNNTWPANGEIDVMEYFRGNLHSNVIWEGSKNENSSLKKIAAERLGGKDWAENFHVWEMDWDETKIVFSLDSEVIHTVNLNKTINFHKKNNPFQSNFYLLLNLAMGQNGERIPDESLPSQLIVDYVRIYQKVI